MTATTVSQLARPTRPATARNMSRLSSTLHLIVLSVAALYFLVPIWWIVVSATKSNAGLFSSNGFGLARFDLLANLKQIFVDEGGHYPLWMLNSFIYAGFGGAVATLIGAACGYGLAKFDLPGRNVIMAVITAGILLPASLLTVPLYLLFARIGLVNTYWAVLIPSMVSPFAVYLSLVYAETVPNEIIDAARVDGAGEWRIFCTIVLRIMSPALVTVFLFSFVGIWNNFFLPLIMLNDPSMYPVALGIYSWYTQVQRATYNIVITGSLISIIPLVIAFLSLQRFWRAGLTAGSVKA